MKKNSIKTYNSLIICLIGLQFTSKNECSQLVKELGFKIYSTGDYIRNETERVFGEITFDTVNKFYNDFILLNPMLSIQPILKKNEFNNTPLLVIDSLKNFVQLNTLYKITKEIITVSLWAPKNIRFKRLSQRSRQDDPKDINEFNFRDNKEIKFGIGDIFINSDYFIDNTNRNISLKEFRKLMENLLAKYNFIG